jgi:endonuclease-3
MARPGSARRPPRRAAPARRTTAAAVRRESRPARRRRAAAILDRLAAEYPDSRPALDFTMPLELLVATILSAQCTDKRVNAVTPELFRRYPDARAYAEADLAELEELVHPTGFYRQKARALRALGAALAAEHGGRVPETMAELTALPGVGRKTANVVLGNAFGASEGVVVDTHVHRLARRLGLAADNAAEKIEAALMALVPRERWTLAGNLLIEHGRRICHARRPDCPACVLADLCPSAAV